MTPADTAWTLTAVALVLLMLPGIAVLYGGMLSGRSVVNMLMMVMSSLAVTAMVYVSVGHGLVAGESLGGMGIIGDPRELSFFSGFEERDSDPLTAVFYLVLATVSVALVASGAAGRMKFDAWMIFAALWVLLVYAPVAHWVFGGWIYSPLGLHDYGGGAAIHLNAAAAGLAVALVLGRRAQPSEEPHNLPLMLIGVGLVTVGWLGFNGGKAGGANFLAQYVVLSTVAAFAGGILCFLIVERVVDGNDTVLGLGTGGLAGMAAITPVADAVNPAVAVVVGALGAAGTYLVIHLKTRFRVDDAADVFAVHGVAGIIGAMVVVFIADPSLPAGRTGVFYGGGLDQIWRESAAFVVIIAYSFCVTFLICWLMNKVHPIRFDADTEEKGVDSSIHEGEAYRAAP